MHLLANGRSQALLLVLALAPVTSLAQESGVVLNTDKTSPGYTLIAPLGSTTSYLIDLSGNVVHQWESQYRPGQSAYLLEDGSLLRAAKVEDNPAFPARGGSGGRVQRFEWNGKLVWDFVYSDNARHQHHDIEPMPNGNVLLIAWESKSRAEAIAAGRDPEKLRDEFLWPETIVEIQPDGKTGGKAVWSWKLWDHLVQSYDRSKANFGNPADHPERVDLNYIRRGNADWIHMNSVDYNAELDQIVLSARWFDEIWIIDHGTSTKEAAGHSGGRCGKGGDLLYRWGNPYAYSAGLPEQRALFAQHDARWIGTGLPGAGNLLLFNNGTEHDDSRAFSSVDELVPPLLEDGSYRLDATAPYGPDAFQWSFSQAPEFFSPRVSGAERQPNGNTLICSGTQGRVFEVDPHGKIVWDFHNNLGNSPGASDRPRTRRGPGRRGQPEQQGRPERGPRGRAGRGRSGDGSGVFRAPRYPADYPAFKTNRLPSR